LPNSTRPQALRRSAQPDLSRERLSREVGGAQILLKREDLNHTGAHKINNTIGQACWRGAWARRRIIAETGAGQHGVASATVAARLGLECVVYMGAVDIERQAINVYRMKLLGATVVPVTSGPKTLKDALNEAMRDWVTNVDHTFYIIGTVAGPHPYPMMVRDFNAIVGREARAQMLSELRKPARCGDRLRRRRQQCDRHLPCLPQRRTACAWSARGGRRGHRDRASRRLARRRSARRAARQPHLPAVAMTTARSSKPIRCQRGLDYPGVGPEHAFLKDTGRAEYVGVTDDEALAAFHLLARTEGILAALESSHAIAQAIKLAREPAEGPHVLCNLSGRGDKDVHTIAGARRSHASEWQSHDQSSLRAKPNCAPQARLRGCHSYSLHSHRSHGIDPASPPCVPLAARDHLHHRVRMHGRCVHALVRHGADLLELGMPFSDPMADGPVIQQANERALAQARRADPCAGRVRAFRGSDGTTPVVLMGYLNPIERYGFERFARDAARRASTACCWSIVRSRKRRRYDATLRELGLHQVYLLAPTTPPDAPSAHRGQGRGFLYYVSFARASPAPDSPGARQRDRGLQMNCAACRTCRSRSASASATPPARGRSARTPMAMVIGSALVERLAGAADARRSRAAVASFLPPIRDALDAIRR
jgi:tryptophan synthase beta chain